MPQPPAGIIKIFFQWFHIYKGRNHQFCFFWAFSSSFPIVPINVATKIYSLVDVLESRKVPEVGKGKSGSCFTKAVGVNTLRCCFPAMSSRATVSGLMFWSREIVRSFASQSASRCSTVSPETRQCGGQCPSDQLSNKRFGKFSGKGFRKVSPVQATVFRWFSSKSQKVI